MTTLAQKNRSVALKAVLFVLVMVGVAFASVPLYRIFCQVTGFGGTPLRAETAPGPVAGRIGIRFDANINPALPWSFTAPERIQIAPGARTVVNYRSKNMVARATTGRAIFNVSPAKAGQYFSKIECFCFTEQTLKPGEEVDMPVVFFVDPKIREDEATSTLDEITLSYTFYPVENPESAR
ncbi:cytochrome c oxidase assembly protein [Sphingomonas sp. GCM10030256]|uniref:cytochrome c oxidase assembly protein n=1 Tax=Sphingomonas sp. GCM10030256 TaxID=3273427 RepID=UPI0036067E9C